MSLPTTVILAATLLLSALAIPISPASAQDKPITLDMSDPKLWTIDLGHLGTRQVEITHDPKDNAAIFLPTWTKDDASSPDLPSRNIDNGRIHTYQLVPPTDCTQSEVSFEILIPQPYIDEGKMEFAFALQAGALGDYLYNGRNFKMSDFAATPGAWKQITLLPADYNEDLEKLRKIERINIIFERKGSLVSAPIKVRNLTIKLNKDKIVPPAPDLKVINPTSSYHFPYNTPESVAALESRISAESMDITRAPNPTGGVILTPQWGPNQIPPGHTGDVTLVQPLPGPHNFEPFKVEYVFNIPAAYFEENKIQIVPFVQAGEKGYYVWSGVTKDYAPFKDKAGQDITLTLSSEDFLVHKQKKKNLIEMIGFKIDRHGSTLTQPIILKSITIKLDDQAK